MPVGQVVATTGIPASTLRNWRMSEPDYVGARRWSPEVRALAIKLYTDGDSLGHAARQAGVPPATLEKWLGASGVPRHGHKPRGSARRSPLYVDPKVIQFAVLMYSNNYSTAEIGRALNRHPTTVRGWFRKRGIAIRDRGTALKLAYDNGTRRRVKPSRDAQGHFANAA
jgi:transposase-like protein